MTTWWEMSVLVIFNYACTLVEKTMTEILSFVEENKTEMKGLGFSSIYKGDLFAWKTPFAPSNFDAKQYSGLYGDDTILNHFIVTVNTNHVREEISSVLDDIVTKIENKDVKNSRIFENLHRNAVR